MTQHDTPEAVEAMAAWHGEGKAWPAGVPIPQMHADQATAAMLRRLHTRAVDAEDHLGHYTIALEEARASLATARADALRGEAVVMPKQEQKRCNRLNCSLYVIETEPPLDPPLTACSNPDCDRAIRALATQETPDAR